MLRRFSSWRRALSEFEMGHILWIVHTLWSLSVRCSSMANAVSTVKSSSIWNLILRFIPQNIFFFFWLLDTWKDLSRCLFPFLTPLLWCEPCIKSFWMRSEMFLWLETTRPCNAEILTFLGLQSLSIGMFGSVFLCQSSNACDCTDGQCLYRLKDLFCWATWPCSLRDRATFTRSTQTKRLFFNSTPHASECISSLAECSTSNQIRVTLTACWFAGK